jgi:site-specific recombinase XerD
MAGMSAFGQTRLATHIAINFEASTARSAGCQNKTGIMFGPFTFRHTWAAELLRRGVAVRAAAQLLGHASIAPTGTPSHT